MRVYSREELRELAAGYALGALGAEEAAAVEAALPGDADLRREVESFRAVAGAMLTSEPPMAPAHELRGRWLDRARGNGGARAIAERRSETRGAGNVIAIRALGTLLAASLVVAVTLGVQVRDARHELDTAQAMIEQRERQLNTVLEAENALHVAVLRPAALGETGVQVYWNVRQKRGMLHAFHLTPAPAGRAYQLWVIRDGTPVSVRVFNSDVDGHALVEQLDLPDSADGVSLVAITVEPASGSPQPTSAPIMAGALLRATDKN
jgi:anti-sigma-K factor RskA